MDRRSRLEEFGGAAALLALAVTATAAVDGTFNRVLVMACGIGACVLLAGGQRSEGGVRLAFLTGCTLLSLIATVVFVRADGPGGSPVSSGPADVPTPPATVASAIPTPQPSPPSTAPSSPRQAARPPTPAPHEVPVTRKVQRDQVISLYGASLHLTATWISHSVATFALSTANATCRRTPGLASPLLFVDSRSGWWYDLTLLAVEENKTATIRIRRGRGEPPARSTVCDED